MPSHSGTFLSDIVPIKDDAWKDLVNRVKTDGSYIHTELQEMDVVFQMEKQRSSFLRVPR
jgi:hypothetical protein